MNLNYLLLGLERDARISALSRDCKVRDNSRPVHLNGYRGKPIARKSENLHLGNDDQTSIAGLGKRS